MGGIFPLRPNRRKSYALIMHSQAAAQKPKREKAHLDTHRQGTGFCQELSACCKLQAAFFLLPRHRQARSTATIASPLATTNYNAIANARRLFISVSVCVAGKFMRIPSVSCADIYLGLLPMPGAMQNRLVSHKCKLQWSRKPSHGPLPLGPAVSLWFLPFFRQLFLWLTESSQPSLAFSQQLNFKDKSEGDIRIGRKWSTCGKLYMTPKRVN